MSFNSLPGISCIVRDKHVDADFIAVVVSIPFRELAAL